MFFIYENWTNTFCKVHHGSCSFCNGGEGIFGGGKTESGQWHSGYVSREAALAAARALAASHQNAHVWIVDSCQFCADS